MKSPLPAGVAQHHRLAAGRTRARPGVRGHDPATYPAAVRSRATGSATAPRARTCRRPSAASWASTSAPAARPGDLQADGDQLLQQPVEDDLAGQGLGGLQQALQIQARPRRFVAGRRGPGSRAPRPPPAGGTPRPARRPWRRRPSGRRRRAPPAGSAGRCVPGPRPAGSARPARGPSPRRAGTAGAGRPRSPDRTARKASASRPSSARQLGGEQVGPVAVVVGAAFGPGRQGLLVLRDDLAQGGPIFGAGSSNSAAAARPV